MAKNGEMIPSDFIKTGKRANKKDYLSVADGQKRLFGGEGKSNVGMKTGKRVISDPHANGLNIIQ